MQRRLLVIGASGSFAKIDKENAAIGFLRVLIAHCDQGPRDTTMADFIGVDVVSIVILPPKHLRWPPWRAEHTRMSVEILLSTHPSVPFMPTGVSLSALLTSGDPPSSGATNKCTPP